MTDLTDKTQVSSAVLDFLADEVGLDPEEIDADTGLFTTGKLDSMDIIKIVAFMEKDLGLKVSPFEVSLQNLNSLNLISDFVAGKASA
jgi:acyl carrier protein